ncbi:1-aminocyclopropane-1-carboxylate deaminase/D-cysteine desulfhydrase [Kribbella sp. NPDC051620]|uniref:1-aminocyclopropane-1-carboxylate deaminase/D-cysteine desulfhydrase n=1 Tax=Kribbella sp. NPDC051620 TaxID=3364120 RepID=UPI0037A67CD4
MLDVQLPSPLSELHDDRLDSAGVRVLLKRDDLIHPEVPGNKWRKLKYNLGPALEAGTLLTFGGAYSNHLRAVAAAGHHYGFATIGVVRGEEHLPLNPSLAYAAAHGMRLTYLDRTTYRSPVLEHLHQEFGDFHLVPEGGANPAAVRGCTEILTEIDEPYDALFCAVGTGTTLAGLAADPQAVIGVPVLKASLESDVVALQQAAFGERVGNWRLLDDYHFGGYARRTPALDAFIDDFTARHTLILDWVYEAKMMYALFDQVRRRAFQPGTTIVALIN